MNEHLSRAARYRARAEELSTIAESMADPQAKQMLRGVAADYAHMAETVEKIDANPQQRASRL
jgi:hypothetical protein